MDEVVVEYDCEASRAVELILEVLGNLGVDYEMAGDEDEACIRIRYGNK